MVDIKKLLTKILLRFNNYTKVAETQTFTALNKSWKFRRIGNVVYVDASSDANGSIPAGTSSIGTLPASMRPENNVYLKCTNNNADWRLYIAPSGAVTFYHPTATSGAVNCGFSGYSFIAGGGYCINALLSTIERWWRYVRCESIAGEDCRMDKWLYCTDSGTSKHNAGIWSDYCGIGERGSVRVQTYCDNRNKQGWSRQRTSRLFGLLHLRHNGVAHIREHGFSIKDIYVNDIRTIYEGVAISERGCIAC